MATRTTSKKTLKNSASFDLNARSLPASLLIFVMVSGFVFFWLSQKSPWHKSPETLTVSTISKSDSVLEEIPPTKDTNAFSETTWQEYAHYLAQGQAFKTQNDYRSALESLQKAKTTLDSPEIRQAISEVLFLEQVSLAEDALQRESLETAVHHWKKALSFQESESLRAQLFKAELKLQSQQLEQQNQAILASLLTKAEEAAQKEEWKEALKWYSQAKNLGNVEEKMLHKMKIIQQKIAQKEQEEQFQDYFKRAHLLLEQDFFQGLAYLKQLQKEFPAYQSECLFLRKKSIQKRLDALLVTIPEGTYRIGSDENEDEKPIHSIHLSRFQIDQVPVTHWQYALFLEDSRLAPPPYWIQGKYPSGEENYPVVEVSFEEATLFARWANKRLPTEFEWEAAARTQKEYTFPWGNEMKNNRSNHRGTNFSRTCAVDQFPANSNGLFDLVGNISQWTDSSYTSYPNGTLLLAYGKGYKTIRGGSFLLPLEHLRLANRSYESPLVRLASLGFRCAR